LAESDAAKERTKEKPGEAPNQGVKGQGVRLQRKGKIAAQRKTKKEGAEKQGKRESIRLRRKTLKKLEKERQEALRDQRRKRGKGLLAAYTEGEPSLEKNKRERLHSGRGLREGARKLLGGTKRKIAERSLVVGEGWGGEGAYWADTEFSILSRNLTGELSAFEKKTKGRGLYHRGGAGGEGTQENGDTRVVRWEDGVGQEKKGKKCERGGSFEKRDTELWGGESGTGVAFLQHPLDTWRGI